MVAKFTLILALAVAFFTPVLSTVVVTSPVASTTGHGDKHLTVEWNDDNTSPKLSDWGKINIYLATGSHDVQYKLQALDTNVDVDEAQGRYKIDQDVGPDGGYYFIRFEGTKTDAKGIPPMSFSARFTLEDMKGDFNSTIKAELSGAGGTASVGGGASKTGMATAAIAKVSSTSVANSAAARPTTSSASSSSNTTTSGAATTKAGYLTALVGLVAIGSAFL